MLAKDAFRMGNYSPLGYLGGNLGLEFLYSGPHSLVSRMHLNVNTEGWMAVHRLRPLLSKSDQFCHEMGDTL
jgi:hypothetical protein